LFNFAFNSLDIGFAVSIIHQSDLFLGTGSGKARARGGFMSVLELCDREIASVPLEATVADAINKMLGPSRRSGRRRRLRIPGRRNFSPNATCSAKMALSRTDPQTTSVRETHDHAGGDGYPPHRRRRGRSPPCSSAHFRHLPVADDDGKLLGILFHP